MTLYAFPTNLGQIVTLPYGSPVYVDTREHSGSQAACTGACAKLWVPVITGPAPAAKNGVKASQVGTSDFNGQKQVTYFGHRLYYYALDRHPLKATGQGAGGVWYVILPSGQILKQ